MRFNNGDTAAYSIILGGGYKPIVFEFDKGTEIYYSCSVQWHNHHYVFGGYRNRRQVSMVNGKRLERKQTLNFSYWAGGCTVLSQRTILLCFGSPDESNVCRQSNNPLGSFNKLPNSNTYHYRAKIASFDGKKTIY